VSVKFAGIEFDNVFHDAEADVLYLDVGEPRAAVDFNESTEGHHLRWDARGQLVGITILNARRHLEREGKIKVSLPELEVEASDLEGVLSPV
jgi:YD repeat-containing protein